ncbi:TetR/AcrR family transcriptional regulator [Hamadaea sp. NPDC051192]|uniref:TetR/AcrR family transcriptional regulator n=1 Tax=Hamadaea sp. NPDC051192 TaxID=3154940 RepID=UPI00344AB3D6
MSPAPTGGRRRADAERSRTAILDAAIHLLARQPDAGMAAIATAAGVTRQTVYAHFASRDVLLIAVVDRISEQATVAMDAADLDRGPAIAALLRLQDISWQLYRAHPVLADAARPAVPAEHDRRRHHDVQQRLTQLIQRGQASGEIDPHQPADWLVNALTALGHAAGDQVAAEHLSVRQAAQLLRTATVRLLAP